MPKDLYAEFEDTGGSDTTTSNVVVSNVFPKIQSKSFPYRIAFIGEAPGADEIAVGTPFVGYSGQLLDKFLSRFNILRDACFIGNICQHRPPANKIAAFDWDGPEIQSGLARLQQDLKVFRPNIVMLLGGSALHAFRDPLTIPKRKKAKDGLAFVFPNSISNWRGSFFISHPESPCSFVKSVASYHPAACLRQYDYTPLLMFDIQRMFKQSTFPELKLPQRTIKVGLNFYETVAELEAILASTSDVGTDIEGYWNAISCISFAPARDYAFIVPFTNGNGLSYWSVDQEMVIMRLVSRILAHPGKAKIWQNGLYDRFCLQYGYKMVVRGPSRDIMLKTWELYCELPKALSVQASLYTLEPYWKHERIQAEQKET